MSIPTRQPRRARPSGTRFGPHRHVLAVAAMLALAGAAQAQVSTATIKGTVAAAPAATAVVARNVASGATYRTTTLADGSYALTGLAPGTYEVSLGTGPAQTITVQVAETASLDLGDAAQRVVITGSAARRGVKTSEVGTNISRRTIETIPQTTRNFLSAADLAPGVAFSSDNSGNTSVQSGAQNFDHVNVFVDGVGQKNNILRGGLTGQDTSRGNPFPQSAIAEYKVITQNYKAEFDQVSSAAITAVTRSGTNELHGDAYVDRTGTSWRSKTQFEREAEAASGLSLPPSKKYEFGASLGGPIVPDRVHFFVAYDGKNIDDSRVVTPQKLENFPPNAGIIPTLRAFGGTQVDSFREHLVFGKIDAQLSDAQRLTASVRVRRESDHIPESRLVSAPGNDKNRKNDETRVDVKHEWSGDAWLNEARLGYEDYVWNPQSSASTPFIKYRYSTSTPPRLDGAQDVLFVGGSPDAQRRGQRGWTIGDDLTYSGLAGHVVKGGVRLKRMKYELSGTAFGVDTVETVIDTVTGQPYYDGTNCLGTSFTDSGVVQSTDQCRIRRAIAGAAATFSNSQIGIYLQDDWAVTKQLEVNLGVRWDVESNMLNNGYVTPADRVAALRGPDGRTIAGIVAPPGQTYAQSLAKGGVNIDDYISTGSSRKRFNGAIAPRVGASYDLFGDRATVVFGGWGRAYDRTMANHALDELQKNAQPGGEIWLIRNDFKMPYADQFSLGVRQGLGAWNAEVALSRIDAKNQFIWFGGNRDPNGGYGTQSPIDPLWGGPNGYGTLILGDFVGQTRTNALLAKLEKPYSAASGWSANVAYTYSDAKTTSKEWNNDIFDWTYGRPGVRGWNPSTLVEKHRLVAAGFVENLFGWGINFSAKATYGSGYPYRITDCSQGFSACVSRQGDAPSFRQIDLGVAKEFRLWTNLLTLRLDVLNVLNTTNYGGFDTWGGGPVGAGQASNALGGDNVNLGKPNAIRGDPRTARLVLSYRF